MARIKIKDLKKPRKISEEKLKQVRGGLDYLTGSRSARYIAPTFMTPLSVSLSSLSFVERSGSNLSTIESA